MTSEYPVVLQEGVAPEVANSLPRPQLAPSHLPGEARVASDCKHNCDLHTYQRGALHSWPALLLYRHGSLWDPTPRWQEQFWRVPADRTPILNQGSRRHRALAPGARRSLPIRPYLHARITRITSVEQLPQIMNIVIIIAII